MKPFSWLAVLLLASMCLVVFAPTASAGNKKRKYDPNNGYYTTQSSGYNTGRAQNGVSNGLQALLGGNGSYGAARYSQSRAPSYTSYSRASSRSVRRQYQPTTSAYYPTTTRSKKKYYYLGH